MTRFNLRPCMSAAGVYILLILTLLGHQHRLILALPSFKSRSPSLPHIVRYRHKDVASRSPLIVFGDSLSDTGNFGRRYHMGGYWFRHFTNGPVWNEYLATILDMQLYNFAYSGAITNKELTAGYLPEFDFIPSLCGRARGTVAVVGASGIDVFRMMDRFATGEIDLELYIKNVTGIITSNANFLLEKGLADRVVIWNLVPLELTMYEGRIFYHQVRRGCLAYRRHLQNWYNHYLDSPEHSDMWANSVVFVDMWSFYRVMILPSVIEALNIKFTFERCMNSFGIFQDWPPCRHPDDYLFYDQAHYSTRVNALIGAVLARLLEDPQYEISESNLLGLIAEYQIGSVNATHNIFVNSDVDRVVNVW
ncbi:hypothetical protein EV182_000691 [Spiromyces aspiralis]|uniref:Uncharacterized protein n=1 Tax=Spiromyces aspiralis TaxID=68401 RepID=A0ACC1HKF3_9FUNG|nr:hypothetical protein EV182_000691 [Spiromyces aspiralis]